jgi:hypothetical protein
MCVFLSVVVACSAASSSTTATSAATASTTAAAAAAARETGEPSPSLIRVRPGDKVVSGFGTAPAADVPVSLSCHSCPTMHVSHATVFFLLSTLYYHACLWYVCVLVLSTLSYFACLSWVCVLVLSTLSYYACLSWVCVLVLSSLSYHACLWYVCILVFATLSFHACLWCICILVLSTLSYHIMHVPDASRLCHCPVHLVQSYISLVLSLVYFLSFVFGVGITLSLHSWEPALIGQFLKTLLLSTFLKPAFSKEKTEKSLPYPAWSTFFGNKWLYAFISYTVRFLSPPFSSFSPLHPL